MMTTRQLNITAYPVQVPTPRMRRRRRAGSAPTPAPVTEPQADCPSEADELFDIFLSARGDERRLVLLNLDAAAASPIGFPAAATADIINRLESAALAKGDGDAPQVRH